MVEQSDSSFQFISCATPAAARDKSIHRTARSHGARQSQIKKRQKLIARHEHFRNLTAEDLAEDVASRHQAVVAAPPQPDLPSCLEVNGSGLFSLTDTNASRLRDMLGHPRARQALDPVFSISDKFQHQTFGTVLRAGIHDAAVENALMMSLALAMNDDTVNADVLLFKSRVIQQINDRIANPARDSMDAVIVAVLLLVGVERRLGARPYIQLHLNGTRQLLQYCDKMSIYLSDGVKRALFWQDLMSALTMDTQRTIHHDTFSELHWRRDSLVSLYTLPSGFEAARGLLPDDLVLVLEDIHALQRLRDLPSFNPPDGVTVRQLDNHQAWIESRLFELYSAAREDDLVLRSCILAANIVAYGLFTEIWVADWIPAHCAGQIAQYLQQGQDLVQWEGYGELLAWVLFTGATFAPSGTARLQYARMLHGPYQNTLTGYLHSWDTMLSLLRSFLWSDALFTAKGRQFWDACGFS